MNNSGVLELRDDLMFLEESDKEGFDLVCSTLEVLKNKNPETKKYNDYVKTYNQMGDMLDGIGASEEL